MKRKATFSNANVDPNLTPADRQAIFQARVRSSYGYTQRRNYHDGLSHADDCIRKEAARKGHEDEAQAAITTKPVKA